MKSTNVVRNIFAVSVIALMIAPVSAFAEEGTMCIISLKRGCNSSQQECVPMPVDGRFVALKTDGYYRCDLNKEGQCTDRHEYDLINQDNGWAIITFPGAPLSFAMISPTNTFTEVNTLDDKDGWITMAHGICLTK